MFFEFLFPLADSVPLFNVFRYLTFRSGGAMMTSLIICFVFGPSIIRWLKAKQKKGQPIRDDGPQSHLVKQGTPTMGGAMILLSVSVSTLLWSDLSNGYVWTVLFVTLAYGLIGFADDWLKVSKTNPKGLRSWYKMAAQLVVAAIAAVWLSLLAPDSLGFQLAVPVFKDVLVNFGYFYIPFIVLVIVGASNAVNLTDGLDGLAIVPIMIATASLGLIAYLIGNINFANYLQVHYVPGTGELAVFAMSVLGAGLGFLWFNAPPAKIFMGDTGSLAAGGAIGTIAVATKHEVVLAIIGGLFVVETLSVMIQVASFKLTGKRVFRMAPIHHHFEQKGLAEETIVIRAWIIAVILAMIGLATLKLR